MKTGFTFLFLVMLWPAISAAQQTIGYVNTDEIISELPAYSGIQQQLQQTASQWRAELDAMQQAIDSLKADFADNELLYTAPRKADAQETINNQIAMRRAFRQEKFGPEGDYFKRQKELLEPIQRRIFDALMAVVDRQNIDFVFDRAQNTSMLYGQSQWNLNEDVLHELGITLSN